MHNLLQYQHFLPNPAGQKEKAYYQKYFSREIINITCVKIQLKLDTEREREMNKKMNFESMNYLFIII